MTIKFPEPDSVKEMLEMLLGDAPALAPASDSPALASLNNAAGSICFDDAGNPVMMIFADFPATVFMGGKLMLMPNGRLEDLMDEGSRDESIVEAVSEVFNNLTTTINSLPGNPHIRSAPATDIGELLGAEDSSWVGTPGQRFDLSGNFLGKSGRISFLVK